jgi:hypothetical protein
MGIIKSILQYEVSIPLSFRDEYSTVIQLEARAIGRVRSYREWDENEKLARETRQYPFDGVRHGGNSTGGAVVDFQDFPVR